MFEVNNVTTDLVKLALDASQLRLETIANNIANVNTKNFSPMRVNFEQQLEIHKANLLDRTQDGKNAELLKSIVPQVEKDRGVSIEGVDRAVLLDMEIATLAKNVLHYQVLLEANSKRGAVVKMAVSGEVT
jgi:flagellar basal-body rod protein FlgB